tara:strand:- start:23621 stop:23959 length:339 start_codon:yes stop_codon:yes gene_type:complete
MTFGNAINLVKKGKMIQRAGWNGRGLFVFMQVPAEISILTVPVMQSLPQAVKDEFEKRYDETVDDGVVLENEEDFNSIKYNNQLALVDPSNNITGWSPSTSDALATDWLEYI